MRKAIEMDEVQLVSKLAKRLDANARFHERRLDSWGEAGHSRSLP